MTKEEAIDACKQHANDVQALGVLIALSGLSFAAMGLKIEKALELPGGSLAEALMVPQKLLLQALSDYVAVLENAAKGQLASVEEEWEELINE